jgi:hypothetical protein
MKRKHIVVFVIVLLLTAVPLGAAYAAPPFQEDTVVETGETVRNDVVLFDGDLEVEEGGVINGDVVLFNGDADIAGTINGDLVLFNGDFSAGETAVISGDCVVFNGSIDDQTAAGLDCTNVEGMPAFMGGLVNNVSPQSGRHGHNPPHAIVDAPPSAGGRFAGGVLGAIARSVLFAAFAFVVVALAPNHLQQIESTIRMKPIASGTVGFLTAIAVPALVTILTFISAILVIVCIGFVGLALAFAMMAALGIAALFGWIAMGDLMGQWLAGRFGWHKMSPAVVAAFGVGLMTFLLGFLTAVPFTFGVGLVSLVIGFIGLGAVALTRFGARPYPLIVFVEDDIKINSVLDTLPDKE